MDMRKTLLWRKCEITNKPERKRINQSIKNFIHQGRREKTENRNTVVPPLELPISSSLFLLVKMSD
jgi:hypothetical protein